MRTTLKYIFSIILFVFSLNAASNNVIANIVATYNANEAKFQVEYKGMKITGSATVFSIKSFPGEGFYIVLKENKKNTIMCNAKDPTSVAKLTIKAMAKFEGIIDDVDNNILIVSNCLFELFEYKKDITSKPSSPPTNNCPYNKFNAEQLIKSFKDDIYYSDVPVLDCKSNNQQIKLICSDPRLFLIERALRQQQIYSYENGSKTQLNHKVAFRYRSACENTQCIEKDFAKIWNQIDLGAGAKDATMNCN